MLTVVDHELLELYAFVTRFPGPLGGIPSPEPLTSKLTLEVDAPLQSNDEVRAAVRSMLRRGGFKPAGRNKPASEYLIRAASQGKLGSINAAVDACNVASLHSGLPISVVDLEKTRAPLCVDVAAEESDYVFNASGQVIDVTGLLCLFDADGPCANAVKDAHRTKTHDQTITTLSLVWGATALPGRAAQTGRWYQQLLSAVGAATEAVAT